MENKKWFTADEITQEINLLNITGKNKSQKRIQEILKKIAKKEAQNSLFKIKKDPHHTGRGRKQLLYNISFLQKVKEYYYPELYFTENEAVKNLINKHLITPNTIDNFFPPNVKRRFNSPLEIKNFERKIYQDQLSLGLFMKNKVDEYEYKVQTLKKERFLQDYKEVILKSLLSTRNLPPVNKLKLIQDLTTSTNIVEISLLHKKIKRLKFKRDRKP
ncbi:hypothetical protein [Limosilactobacillus reuteri]|uniref:hypothetical protein n=1 Tax=Limosilactobacillus reuteri TaxID=1598 RepID=UPI0021A6A7B5|nr:hypothetical protein [Limosilactobacillus reuteri]MCT3198325.1 hypothetical protein [Limosilactobacillus reuteri]